MTVGELIDELSKYDKDLVVVFHGFNEPEGLEIIKSPFTNRGDNVLYIHGDLD